MNAELAGATVDAIGANQDAGAIVITGTDPAFCAGLDLRELGVPKLLGPAALHGRRGRVARSR